MTRIVSWFSCGNNSAVASKLTIEGFPTADVVIARCVVANEHPDNERMHVECERWFQRPILRLSSTDYADCWEVWEDRRYISGIHGAPCTEEMKKAVRWQFERDWNPDYQVFGYSIEEKKRRDKFTKNNPDVKLLAPLIGRLFTKGDCARIVAEAGIALPIMYGLGFSNNNCIGCAKATSIKYWAATRYHFPEEFARMSELSRRLGCRLTRLKGVRIFLDEIPPDIDFAGNKGKSGCGILCG